MNRYLVALVLGTAATAPVAFGQTSYPARESRVFELRTYYAAEGKLDVLNARFRDHTVRLYQKHGLTPIGFWSPQGNPDNKLVILLAYPSRAARDAAWRSLAADPEWTRVRKASDRSGKLVQYIEEEFLSPTSYSPVVTANQSGSPRTYELRISTVQLVDADRLHARLRTDDANNLKEQGLTPVGIFTLDKPQQSTEVTLVTLLARGGKPARAIKTVDPLLLVAYGEPAMKPVSGTITATDGKKSEMLKPTDYSPLK